MRSFKNLRHTILEYHGSTPFSGWRGRLGPMDGQNSLDFNQNLSKLMPSDIDRINTYLGSISAKAYINPDEAFKEIWNTFQAIGLNFTPNVGDSLRVAGERVYELDLFGGYFGKDGSSYDYTRENMIERKLGHKLGLMISSKNTMDGSTNLSARIVPM